MDLPNLDDAYRRILEESRRKGDLRDEAPGAERRRNPRIRVNPAELPADLDPWVFAIDISISGMAFLSEEPAQVGEIVTLALSERLSVEAEVVGCHAEPAEAPGGPPRYRLHCRFGDEEQGKRLLVALKELEAQGR